MTGGTARRHALWVSAGAVGLRSRPGGRARMLAQRVLRLRIQPAVRAGKATRACDREIVPKLGREQGEQPLAVGDVNARGDDVLHHIAWPWSGTGDSAHRTPHRNSTGKPTGEGERSRLGYNADCAPKACRAAPTHPTQGRSDGCEPMGRRVMEKSSTQYAVRCDRVGQWRVPLRERGGRKQAVVTLGHWFWLPATTGPE